MSDEINTEDAGDDWAAALAEQADAKQADAPGGALLDEDDIIASAGKAPVPEKPAGNPAPKQDVQRAQFDDLREDPGSRNGEEANLDVILDIPVTVSMEIGRTRINIRNLLQLNQGSVVELDRLAGEPMDVLVNGTLIAHGEVVVVNEKFGIRLTDVISPAERVKKLK
jgi:flagellar motor switch protein FliN/FliY